MIPRLLLLLPAVLLSVVGTSNLAMNTCVTHNGSYMASLVMQELQHGLSKPSADSWRISFPVLQALPALSAGEASEAAWGESVAEQHRG